MDRMGVRTLQHFLPSTRPFHHHWQDHNDSYLETAVDPTRFYTRNCHMKPTVQPQLEYRGFSLLSFPRPRLWQLKYSFKLTLTHDSELQPALCITALHEMTWLLHLAQCLSASRRRKWPPLSIWHPKITSELYSNSTSCASISAHFMCVNCLKFCLGTDPPIQSTAQSPSPHQIWMAEVKCASQICHSDKAHHPVYPSLWLHTPLFILCMWHVVIRINGFTYRQETTADVRVTAQPLRDNTDDMYWMQVQCHLQEWKCLRGIKRVCICEHWEAEGSTKHIFSPHIHIICFGPFQCCVMTWNCSLQPLAVLLILTESQWIWSSTSHIHRTSVVSISPSQRWLWETHNLSLSHSHLWTPEHLETIYAGDMQIPVCIDLRRQCYPLNHRSAPSTSCSRLCWQLAWLQHSSPIICQHTTSSPHSGVYEFN